MGNSVAFSCQILFPSKYYNSFFSIFKVAQKAMNGTVFCQLFFGALFISISNFELELVILLILLT